MSLSLSKLKKQEFHPHSMRSFFSPFSDSSSPQSLSLFLPQTFPLHSFSLHQNWKLISCTSHHFSEWTYLYNSGRFRVQYWGLSLPNLGAGDFFEGRGLKLSENPRRHGHPKWIQASYLRSWLDSGNWNGPVHTEKSLQGALFYFTLDQSFHSHG